MPSSVHSALTGPDLHVPGYIASLDPLAVGAGKLWVDTSLPSGQWAIRIRNNANTGWEYIGGRAAITSGAIDGTPIGATTPSSGAFTTITASQDLTMSRASGDSHLAIDAPAGTWREYQFKSGGSLRWVFGTTNEAESGSNAGTNFKITRFSDAGGGNGDVLSINRSTGKATFTYDVQIQGALDHDGSTAGFYGATPVVRQTYTAMSGTADRATSYATSTVTLVQLAGRVKAMEDDLKAVGLFS